MTQTLYLTKLFVIEIGSQFERDFALSRTVFNSGNMDWDGDWNLALVGRGLRRCIITQLSVGGLTNFGALVPGETGFPVFIGLSIGGVIGLC